MEEVDEALLDALDDTVAEIKADIFWETVADVEAEKKDALQAT